MCQVSAYMDLRQYLWAMGLGTCLAAFAWMLVLFRVDPEEAGAVGHTLFYLTLFTFFTGVWCLVGTWYRVHFKKGEHLVSRAVKISFRHAVMLAGVGTLSLMLSAQGWLHWWNFLLQFAMVGLVEYLFLLVQESHRT